MALSNPSKDSSNSTTAPSDSRRRGVPPTAKSAVTTLASNVCSGVQTAFAGDTSRLTYEVKLNLDPASALDDELTPAQALCEAFKFKGAYKENTNLYLETAGRDFQTNGWINRIRAKRHKERLKKTLLSKIVGLLDLLKPAERPRVELTYKRRYKAEGNDLGKAMQIAASEGFVVSDASSPFAAELDWGYHAMTLSFSKKVLVPDVDATDLSDLPEDEIRQIVRDNMAAEEADWAGDGWGRDLVDQTLFAGPIRYRKYLGKWKKAEMVLEVWPIPGEDGETSHICEISFGSNDYVQAAALRAELISILDKMQLLLHNDSLKTGTVLDAYLGPRPEKAPVDDATMSDTAEDEGPSDFAAQGED